GTTRTRSSTFLVKFWKSAFILARCSRSWFSSSYSSRSMPRGMRPSSACAISMTSLYAWMSCFCAMNQIVSCRLVLRVACHVSCRVVRDTTYAGLLLAHHDGVPQVEVDDGDHFVLGRLEEGVL